MGGKKFGVLLCADDSENVKKIYGEHFGAFVRMLGEEGETWKVFRVANGEFPDDEEIKEFDGFVITGSFSDAHGTDVWICRLLNLLKQLDSMKKKVLGICFGHQQHWYEAVVSGMKAPAEAWDQLAYLYYKDNQIKKPVDAMTKAFLL
ncbi:gamma-glutamyl peptidase 5-like [Coffea eugenioides]|uniref:gamma-glutamyl peptidase 5-like n=1 Tax=Coffea eugenioides TaxID=49369 RepID=UPI000F5C4E5E|nr:gamma-glutamyl peptidase 5-like [Coffea arabica]XP_027158147.1 gamma-glutamyl peptidase 5-like [Coffea eugenioides]